MVLPVAWQMGRQCPKGAEITLLLNMDDFWPGFPSHRDVVEELFKGFADRFAAPIPQVVVT